MALPHHPSPLLWLPASTAAPHISLAAAPTCTPPSTFPAGLHGCDSPGPLPLLSHAHMRSRGSYSWPHQPQYLTPCRPRLCMRVHAPFPHRSQLAQLRPAAAALTHACLRARSRSRLAQPCPTSLPPCCTPWTFLHHPQALTSAMPLGNKWGQQDTNID
ncbi:hypothetical protein BC827DRAFT_1193130 [Russula dissimulans]|nr:hypothetical protein BC827DRAFT_1193130 [Russula dissimulans]